MWLLEANIDVHLVDLLSHFGVNSDTAANRGWKALSNGQLVAATVTQGFVCLLARDQLFAESAAKALGINPNFGVVLVNLPQQRWARSYRLRKLRAVNVPEDTNPSGGRDSEIMRQCHWRLLHRGKPTVRGQLAEFKSDVVLASSEEQLRTIYSQILDRADWDGSPQFSANDDPCRFQQNLCVCLL